MLFYATEPYALQRRTTMDRRGNGEGRGSLLMAQAVRGTRHQQSRYAKQERRHSVRYDALRRTAGKIAGISLIAGSFCYLLAPLFLPRERDDGSFIAAVSAHLDAWSASHTVLFTGSLLMVPAVLTLVLLCLLSGRGAVYGLIGGSLALFGVLASTVTTTIGLVVGQMAQIDDYATMEALLSLIAIAVYDPFDTLLLLLWLGMLVLVAGLSGRDAPPGWPFVLLAIATVLGFFSFLSFLSPFFGTVAIAWLGFSLVLRGRLASQRLKGKRRRNVRVRISP